MYRVLASRDEVRDRRAQAAHPPRVRPELVADAPDQVWTWDITKLKTEWRGLYFDLYVMIDIYSRKAVHWEVHATENGDLAREFIENAVIANGGARPDYVHADNGTSMTSKPVADLLSDLRITESHSRPHVCPLTGQSQRFRWSATRRMVRGCLSWGDGRDTHVRHEHGGLLAAA
jgi:transposase InsO family protein